MQADEDDFFRLRFSTPEKPDKEWEDWFREFHARKVMKVEFEPDAEIPLHLSGTMLAMPGAAISDMSISPGISRHQADMIDDDDIFIVGAPSGEVATLYRGDHVQIGGPKVALGRNDDVGYLNVRSTCRLFTVRLTRKLIEPYVPDLSDRLSVTYLQNSPALDLLFSYAQVLMSGQIRGGPELQHVVGTHIHDLAALALGASRDGSATARARGGRAARLAEVKRDVLANLTDPALSPSAVARRQRVSSRYVHMLFDGDGITFSEYVVAQRLLRAERMLVDPRLAHLSVSAIAMAVGFGDLSYFNRTFRRRFGATPTEIRQAARSDHW
jgi:AraC-like DNA-binding protein